MNLYGKYIYDNIVNIHNIENVIILRSSSSLQANLSVYSLEETFVKVFTF